jgi:hypothetical protein
VAHAVVRNPSATLADACPSVAESEACE